MGKVKDMFAAIDEEITLEMGGIISDLRHTLKDMPESQKKAELVIALQELEQQWSLFNA